MTEDIKYLRNCIAYSIGNEETGMAESYKEYKQVLDRVLNRLEQDERVIEEMAEEITKIFHYEGEYSPKYVKDSIKETQRCMMDYFIRKCE